jgi:hypothetical protein
MQENRTNPLVIGCVIAFGFIVIAVALLLGIFIYGIKSGALASIEALPADKIPQRQLNDISTIISLRPNEKILYFYSSAMTVSGDGNLFTNERVVSYTVEEGQHQVFSADYGEIQSVTLHRSDSWIEDSTLEVLLNDGTTIVLWVSPENDKDVDFHAKLQEQMESHHVLQKDGLSR